jgi:hypothetical protein
MPLDLHRARVCDRGGRTGFWRSVRADLNNRGVRDILITFCDGLARLKNAITSAFPRALQRCVVHDAAPQVSRPLDGSWCGSRTSRAKAGLIAVAWPAFASSVLRNRKAAVTGEMPVGGRG